MELKEIKELKELKELKTIVFFLVVLWRSSEMEQQN